MRKVKYRCPACKTVQWIEYSPILSRSLQCRKCQAKFNATYSRPNGAASQKNRAPQPLAPGKNPGKACPGQPSRRAGIAPTAGVRPSIVLRIAYSVPRKYRQARLAAESLGQRLGSYPLSALRYPLLLLIAATLIVAGFGFVHVITGSNLSAPHIVCKSSFGYSETFIKIDRITGMPWVFAKIKYPVGCRVLQETGHIESNEAFERRIKRKFVQVNRIVN